VQNYSALKGLGQLEAISKIQALLNTADAEGAKDTKDASDG